MASAQTILPYNTSLMLTITKKREVTAPKYKLYCITKKQFRPKTISWTFSLTTFQHIFNKSAKMNKANTNQFWAKVNRFAFSVPLCRGFYFIFQFHHCVWLCWSWFTSNFPFLLFFCILDRPSFWKAMASITASQHLKEGLIHHLLVQIRYK